MARLKGLEPLTYWFVASHSIQLSYKRRCNNVFFNARGSIAHPDLKIKSFFQKHENLL